MAISPKNSALGPQEGPHRLPQQIADGVDLSQLSLFKGWADLKVHGTTEVALCFRLCRSWLIMSGTWEKRPDRECSRDERYSAVTSEGIAACDKKTCFRPHFQQTQTFPRYCRPAGQAFSHGCLRYSQPTCKP